MIADKVPYLCPSDSSILKMKNRESDKNFKAFAFTIDKCSSENKDQSVS